MCKSCMLGECNVLHELYWIDDICSQNHTRVQLLEAHRKRVHQSFVVNLERLLKNPLNYA